MNEGIMPEQGTTCSGTERMDRQIYLDFRFYENAKEVHRFLKDTMGFPEYYGMNLDALYDVLTDPCEDTMLTYKTSGKVFERGFIGVFKDAAMDNPHFHVAEG